MQTLNIPRIVSHHLMTILSIQLMPKMLQFGAQDHAFETGPKRLGNIYLRVKTGLKLNGKNMEMGYLYIYHGFSFYKQSRPSCIGFVTEIRPFS